SSRGLPDRSATAFSPSKRTERPPAITTPATELCSGSRTLRQYYRTGTYRNSKHDSPPRQGTRAGRRHACHHRKRERSQRRAAPDGGDLLGGEPSGSRGRSDDGG